MPVTHKTHTVHFKYPEKNHVEWARVRIRPTFSTIALSGDYLQLSVYFYFKSLLKTDNLAHNEKQDYHCNAVRLTKTGAVQTGWKCFFLSYQGFLLSP